MVLPQTFLYILFPPCKVSNPTDIRMVDQPDGADWMNVCADDLSNASGQEVPDDHTAVVAAYS